MSLSVYDFDGTIYKGDSTLDFYFFMLKINPGIIFFIPRQIVGLVKYKLRIINKTKFKEEFYSFLKMCNVSEKILNEFWDKNFYKIYEWYLNNKTKDDIIITASPEFLIDNVARRLEVSTLIASRVNKKTGVYFGANCYGVEKCNRFFQEYGHNKKITSFYSDSISDLPMAKLASNAYLCKKGKITLWKL